MGCGGNKLSNFKKRKKNEIEHSSHVAKRFGVMRDGMFSMLQEQPSEFASEANRTEEAYLASRIMNFPVRNFLKYSSANSLKLLLVTGENFN